MPDNLKKIDWACGLMVVVVGVLSLSLVLIQVGRQRSLVHQAGERVSLELKNLASAEETLKNLETALAAAHKDLEFLKERVPDPGEIGAFLKQVHAKMEERNLQLASLQPQPPLEEEVYHRIPIRMMFQGAFVDIHRLLYDLETMNRVMVEEKLSITRPDLNQDCQVDLTASVFERKKPASKQP